MGNNRSRQRCNATSDSDPTTQGQNSPTLPDVLPPTPPAPTHQSPPQSPINPSKYITIDTNWRNQPYGDNLTSYWAYSGRSDKNSYYFMNRDDAEHLEQAYQQGDKGCYLSHGDQVYVDFNDMMQYTKCGDCHRYVQRLTNLEYHTLHDQYSLYFGKNKPYWALDTKKGYLLYSPAIQDIINTAHDKEQAAQITINKTYTYTVDPHALLQTNNDTGKVRNIVHIKIGLPYDKPVIGSYGLRYEPIQTQTPPVNQHNVNDDDDADAETEIDQSCIYPDPTATMYATYV